MKTFFLLFLAGFVALCGGLVAESARLAVRSGCGRACILLQQTTGKEPAIGENSPSSQGPQLQSADYITLHANNAAAQTVLLGSVDQNSGFKFELELSSMGAAISRASFSKFDNRDHTNPQPLAVLSPVEGQALSLANRDLVLYLGGRQYRPMPLDKLHWQSNGRHKSSDGSQSVRFEAVIKAKGTGEPILKLSKTYEVFPYSYQVSCNLTVYNLWAGEQKLRFDLAGPVGISRESYRSDMRKIVGGFATTDGKVVSSRQEIHSPFLSRKSGLKDGTRKYRQALRTANAEEIERARENLRIGHNLPDRHRQARFLWSAATNKYFAAILRPLPAQGQDYCDWVKDKTALFYNPDRDERANSGDETVGFEFRVGPSPLAAVGQTGSTRTYKFQLYIGPKDKSLFDKNELYQKLGFVETIDFMGCCCPASIIRPLAFGILALMKWMYGFINNYGVVIIILVFLFRLAIHPITKKSQVSMSKMSGLGPKVEEIKKKYSGNKTEMNKHMMAFYREQGATPIMGILPMLLQMPVWIALWTAVYSSIDLRGEPFLPFWITDLSAPDALFRFPAVSLPLLGKLDSFNLLPILMGVAFYLQQKLMPSQATASANPQMAQQQKIMMFMFPLMFPVMLYKAPSGVNLYIMASTFAGVIEQYVIRKHIREKEQAESNGLVPATSKTGGKTKKKKPKPFFKNF